MKLIKYGFGILLSVLIVTSCASKWPEYKVTNEDVSWNMDAFGFGMDEAETPVVVKLQRGVATEALEVPITLTDEHGVYSVSPSKVSFAAGEYEKTVTLTYDYSALVPGVEYIFQLSFNENLAGHGSFSTIEGNGKMLLQYEDYKSGYYSGRWEVDLSIMNFVWIDGPYVSDLDSDEWILQRAKGTTAYYKMILYDKKAYIELKNVGDGTILCDKYSGYNDFATKWSGGQLDWDFTHKGNAYHQETRMPRSEISCSGEELVAGDFIELEGWNSKNNSWFSGGYNMYVDYDVL
ncbi:MAG: hypothetical protein J6Y40_06445 [Bacteroidales bacterium]|nr:hypothetical protein [Bacteroidales bacterium]